MAFKAWLDMHGVPTLTGAWTLNNPPVWTVNPLLSPSYQAMMRDMVARCWQDTYGPQSPNELGAMLACLEALSIGLEMRLVIPAETKKELRRLAAADYMPVF